MSSQHSKAAQPVSNCSPSRRPSRSVRETGSPWSGPGYDSADNTASPTLPDSQNLLRTLSDDSSGDEMLTQPAPAHRGTPEPAAPAPRTREPAPPAATPTEHADGGLPDASHTAAVDSSDRHRRYGITREPQQFSPEWWASFEIAIEAQRDDPNWVPDWTTGGRATYSSLIGDDGPADARGSDPRPPPDSGSSMLEHASQIAELGTVPIEDDKKEHASPSKVAEPDHKKPKVQ